MHPSFPTRRSHPEPQNGHTAGWDRPPQPPRRSDLERCAAQLAADWQRCQDELAPNPPRAGVMKLLERGARLVETTALLGPATLAAWLVTATLATLLVTYRLFTQGCYRCFLSSK